MKPTTQVLPRGLQSETEVLDFVSGVLGSVELVTDLSRSHSPNRVVLLETRGGDQLVAKWFGETSAFFRSLDALTSHTPPLSSAAPRLIDHSESLKTIVMTKLPGRTVSPEETMDPVIHFRLGELLRIFHESSHPANSKDTNRELASALSRHIDEVEEDLGKLATSELRGLGMAILDTEGTLLQPIHGSIRPEHWLIDQDYGLQLLSYSSSEYDPWIVDAKYLERDFWSYDPTLRQAFFSGYDRQPTPGDEVLLRASLASSALSAWAHAKKAPSSKKRRAALWSQVEQVVGATLF